MCYVAHTVQVEARIEPLPRKVHLCPGVVVHVVHVDAHLQHLHLVLFHVGLHEDGLVSRDDDHSLCPVLGMTVSRKIFSLISSPSFKESHGIDDNLSQSVKYEEMLLEREMIQKIF